MTRNKNRQDTQYAVFRLLDSIVHGKRANVFLSISKGDKTFRDLLEETVMSKGGLSDALAQLSKSGMIVSKPKHDRVSYELTPLGSFVSSQLSACEDLVPSFTRLKEKKILLSLEDIIILIEKTNDRALQNLFTDGWTVMLSSESYVRLTEYLDERILEGSKRAKEFENLLYENNLVEVVQMYQNPDNSIRVESYLRKQKKLKPDEAELVATAADQDAVICTSNNRTMLAGFELGLYAIKLDMLNQFVDKQRSMMSSHASVDLRKEDNTKYRIVGSSSTWTCAQETTTTKDNIITTFG